MPNGAFAEKAPLFFLLFHFYEVVGQPAWDGMPAAPEESTSRAGFEHRCGAAAGGWHGERVPMNRS